MTCEPNNSNQIQWFEWIILVISFGAIALVVYDLDGSEAIRQNMPTPNKSADTAMCPFDRSMAEHALLAELALAHTSHENMQTSTSPVDWQNLGIPEDETDFLEYWINHTTDSLYTAGDWMDYLLEAHGMYQTVNELMTQSSGQWDVLRSLGERYQLPPEAYEPGKGQNLPDTPGQWAKYLLEIKNQQ